MLRNKLKMSSFEEERADGGHLVDGAAINKQAKRINVGVCLCLSSLE